MMSNPLISVIVPVYKTEEYLDRCVESIVNQTYKSLEIILVDDGSPDNCPQLCDKWAEKDSRIKVMHKENGGLANARNSGIDVCNGEYVMFVDSDDYIEYDMVEFLLKLSLDYNADVSRCGFYIEDEKSASCVQTEFNQPTIISFNERIIDLAANADSGTAWNKLYRKAVIKSHPYDKSDGCSEDIMHNYRVYKDVETVVFMDVPKYHYVIRNTSITNSEFSIGAFDIIKAKQTILNELCGDENLAPYLVMGYIKSAFIVLSGCIQNNAFPQKQKELIASILKYKKQILKSGMYSKLDRLKTIILMLSPRIFRLIIKRSHK